MKINIKDNKYVRIVLYTIGISLVGFMHLYMITKIPFGYNVDELGSAYDAFSLGEYGVDRWLKSFPLYLINYKDGQNALYTYLLMIMMKIFGTSKLVVRSIIVISAFVMALYGARLVHLKWKERYADIVFLFLFAVMPVFTMTLRFGLESHLMVSIATVFLFYATKAILNEKKRDFFLCGLFGGLCLYTYALSYIVVPIFILLAFIYVLRTNKIKFYNWLIAAIPFVILATPLLMIQLINYYDWPEMKLGIFTLTKLPGYRVAEITFVGFFEKIKEVFLHTHLFDGILYNSLETYGTLYYISLPFVIIGAFWCIYKVIYSIIKKSFDPVAFPVFWMIGEYFMGGLLVNADATNITRMNGIFISLIYFCVAGLTFVYHLLKKVILKRSFATIMIIIYMTLFGHFSHYYFTQYSADSFPLKWLFYEDYGDIISYFEDEENELTNDTVYLPWNYMYYVWASKKSPQELNLPANGIERNGRYVFSYPAQVDLTGDYVVYKTDVSSIELLQSLGYLEFKKGDFSIFLHPEVE